MALDAQAATLLEKVAQLDQPAFEDAGPERARAGMERAPSGGIFVEVASVEDRTIAGPGGDLLVRVYRPDVPAGAPVLVFFHGGGWVVGSVGTHDDTCRALTDAVGCVTVSVDYRLAPEHPYPAAPEDCYAGLVWAVEHAAELGADGTRVAVAGDSAGGNLAAAVALMSRDRGGPTLRHQLLIYPVTDFDDATASMEANAEGYFLTRRTMRWFYDCYAPEAAQRDEAYAAPLRAADVSGLASAAVVLAGYDPLFSEGAAYARRLQDAGVRTQVLEFPGQFHGFFGLTRFLDGGRHAQAMSAAALRLALEARPEA